MLTKYTKKIKIFLLLLYIIHTKIIFSILTKVPLAFLQFYHKFTACIKYCSIKDRTILELFILARISKIIDQTK